MKKLLIATILASVATLSFAQGRNDWVGPLIIGGIAGAIIAREAQPTYVQPQPVYIRPQTVMEMERDSRLFGYVRPQPVYVRPQTIYIDRSTIGRQLVCSEWKEIQMVDGSIYRERSCYQTQ
jgi:hypothetical protein